MSNEQIKNIAQAVIEVLEDAGVIPPVQRRNFEIRTEYFKRAKNLPKGEKKKIRVELSGRYNISIDAIHSVLYDKKQKGIIKIVDGHIRIPYKPLFRKFQAQEMEQPSLFETEEASN